MPTSNPIPPFSVTRTKPDGTVEVLYTPTAAGLKAHASTASKLLLWGPRGTGKSKIWYHHALILASTIPGLKAAWVRDTFPNLLKTVLQDIEADCEKLGGHYSRSTHIAEFPHPDGQKSVIFFAHAGGADANVGNLLGAEMHLLIIDEWSTIDWGLSAKLIASVRAPKNFPFRPQVRGTTNPLGQSAEDINRYFILKDITAEEDPEYVAEDWQALRIEADDNPHIDKAEYRKQFAGLPAHVRRAWLDGLFSIAGALFDVRETVDGKPYHVIPELPTIGETDIFDVPWVEWYAGYDHGYFPDPAYWLLMAKLGRRWIAVYERQWKRVVIERIADEIVEIVDRLGIQVRETFIDPSLALRTGLRTGQAVLEEAGIPTAEATNDRLLYASTWHSWLAAQEGPETPRFQMFVPTSFSSHSDLGVPYLARTLPLMQPDAKKPLALADHKHDHPCVTGAYILMSDQTPTETSQPRPKPDDFPWMKAQRAATQRLGAESVRRHA